MTAQADVKMPRIVGIDLGTSNCAVASVDVTAGPGAPIVDFPVPQLVRAGELASPALLPSCLYLAGEHELPLEASRLPWGHAGSPIVGQFARWQGARVPGRCITSAKSWLCHGGVDRTAPILPWGAPDDVQKLSPVDASAQLLQHLVQAWDFAHPDSPLSHSEVVVTVPASFDEVARALTVNAARQAGLDKFTLVEEPQAAFYDFTAQHRADLAAALKEVRMVLVVDVGGGTSDFTLVQVGASAEGPLLRRIAVGDHLMLGGDNMDAALAKRVEELMGKKLTSVQWTQLVQTARLAKEALLGHAAVDHYNLSLVVESSKLIGGTLSSQITRAQAEEIILEGFFPCSGREEAPRRSARAAIQELGLPYAQETAVTKHIAAFLQRHAEAGFAALGQEAPPPPSTFLPRPDAILLNGGVFNSPRIARRLQDAISSWWPEAIPIPLLEHRSLELAVARGAAYSGLVRRGLGRRISGGAARAFYVGLGADKKDTPAQALCVIPRGHEEGEVVEIKNRTFQLAIGSPVQFPLFSTSADRIDAIGAVVPVSEELQLLAPIHSLLKGAAGKSGVVPVHLRAALTEIGTLELWCVANTSDERWRLEFELRGEASAPQSAVIESMPARFGEAREWITQIYGSRLPRPSAPVAPNTSRPEAPREPKHLWGTLEKYLGPREQWRVSLLRELWGALHAGAPKRRRSAQHERIFFQLTGYTLRPGFGYPLDDWRCSQTFAIFPDVVQFHKEIPVWTEFWILWRRLAGGLNPPQQEQLWSYLKPHLATRLLPVAARYLARPKGVQPDGWDEMVRTAAALEHLPPAEKTELGGWILARLRDPANPPGGPWAWAIGRLGARVLIYGSDHNTVPAAIAADWLNQLLKLRPDDGILFALAQLARLTGDRARDLDEAIRERTSSALRAAQAPEPWQKMVAEVVGLESADQARALGDSLPAGLRLV